MSDFENAIEKCDTCGLKLPARAPLGMCPRCMLQVTTTSCGDSEGSAIEEATLKATLVATLDVDEIEGYSLVRQIGEGAFGVVYEAEQCVPVRRRVALKILKPGMDSRQIMARFEAERQALAILEHPFIANVYDAGETERGRPFFAMEFVAGEPMTDYCTTHQLSLKERLKLFGRVCQGVQHAHQKGIIHRDLKPGNILVEGVRGESVGLDRPPPLQAIPAHYRFRDCPRDRAVAYGGDTSDACRAGARNARVHEPRAGGDALRGDRYS